MVEICITAVDQTRICLVLNGNELSTIKLIWLTLSFISRYALVRRDPIYADSHKGSNMFWGFTPTEGRSRLFGLPGDLMTQEDRRSAPILTGLLLAR